MAGNGSFGTVVAGFFGFSLPVPICPDARQRAAIVFIQNIFNNCCGLAKGEFSHLYA